MRFFLVGRSSRTATGPGSHGGISVIVVVVVVVGTMGVVALVVLIEADDETIPLVTVSWQR